MDLRARTDECLILRGRDYNETDRLLIVFSRSFGKMFCLAKGVRRNNSRLKASTQLFSYSKLTFAASKGLAVITQGEAIDVQAGLREDLTKIACAAYIGELLDAALPEEKPQEGLFVLGVSALTLLCSLDEPFLLLRYFELRLLAELGYRLNFGECGYCGRSAMLPRLSACAERGGLLCDSCRSRMSAAYGQALKLPTVSGGTCRLLDGLLNWDLRRIFTLKVTPAMQQEVDAACAAYLAYFLGRPAEKARENLLLYYKV